MSGLDIFAWIVLIVLVASTVFVIVFMAMLPGMIAKKRNHPWGGAGGRLGHAVLRFPAVAGRCDLGLCRYSGPQAGGAAMIVVLLNVYLFLLFLLV